MDGIVPRRQGSERQESMWNHFQPGKANDERRQSLGASRNCRPKERRSNGHRPVLPSCTKGLRCVLKMRRFPTRSGSARTSLALERLELCEGKLSRTVLRGRERATAFAYPVRLDHGMNYQLVLQFRGDSLDDFDALVALEE